MEYGRVHVLGPLFLRVFPCCTVPQKVFVRRPQWSLLYELCIQFFEGFIQANEVPLD